MKHYEVKSGSYKFNIEEFDSAHELVRINKSREVTPQWRGHSLKDDGVSKSFNGVESIDEAYNLLATGWADKVDAMTAGLDGVKSVPMQKRVAFRNDVVGFAPIVPLAMMNVPHSMINNAMKSVKSKVVKILYSMGDSCGVSTEQFFERGKKIMQAVISLERNGYRCELYSAQFYAERGDCDGILVKVKEASQPLDVKRVMFPFTHVSMFRVIGFDWEDRCPSAKRRSARGKPLHVCVSDAEKAVKEAFGSEYIYLDKSVESMTWEDIARRLRGEK